MSQDYKLVLIEWVDSYGCSSAWSSVDNCNVAPMVCKSVGWLIHDDKKCKVVVPHLSQSNHPNANQQGCGDMTIPSPAVLKIVELSVTVKPVKSKKS